MGDEPMVLPEAVDRVIGSGQWCDVVGAGPVLQIQGIGVERGEAERSWVVMMIAWAA